MNTDTILDLMERAAAEHGARTAMLIKPGFRTRTWSYADLVDQGPRVARRRRDRVRPALRFGIDVDPVDATEAIREAIESLRAPLAGRADG